MPFNLVPQNICSNCPYGFCISYVGNQIFKDRATKYRILQSIGMSCAFDTWVPGFSDFESSQQPWNYFTSRVASNAEQAGFYLEGVGAFQDTRHPFGLTAGQKAKVAGDVFESLVRAVLWNCCVDISRELQGNETEQRTIAAVTLGDNYSLEKLFRSDIASVFSRYSQRLQAQDTRLCYSTPDLIVVDLTSFPPEIRRIFNIKIENLSISNQRLLLRSRESLEGHLTPENILFAAGIKTSIRSDRMYQFLFEANAWKFIWREIFKVRPSSYFTIIGSLPYGANIDKLRSVDFTSAQASDQVSRAIDDLVVTTSPAQLKTWFFDLLSNECYETL